jgi:hypothetical protein
MLPAVMICAGLVTFAYGAGARESAVRSCAAKNVRVSLGRSFGTAGTSVQIIVFHNVGSSSCSLAGNPSVGFIDGPAVGPEYEAVPIVGGGDLKAPSGSSHSVLIKPRGSASVALLGGDVQIAHNPEIAWTAFDVKIPGRSSATTFNQGISSYDGFYVTEFTKGSSAGT